VVAILCACSVVSFIDRQIINLLVEDLRRDLGLSDTAIGLLQGLSFALFYAACALPLGRLADVSSRKRLVAAGMCVWTGATALCGLAGNFAQLFCARMLVGAGEATLTPSTYSMIADLFRPQRLALPCGVYAASSFVGSGVALLLGGMILAQLARTGPVVLPLVGELKIWQAAFLCAAALSGVVIVLFLVTIDEPLRRGLQAGRPQERPSLRELLAFYRANRRTFNAVFFGVSLLGAVQFSIGAWTPAYFMRVHGWSAPQAGAAYGLILVSCGTAGAIAGGWLADRLEARMGQGHLRSALLSAFATLPFAAAFPLAPSGAGAVALLAPAVFFGSLSLGAGPALIPVFAPPRMRAVMVAAYLFAASLLGQAMGPALVGLSTDYLFGSPERVRDSLALVPVVLLLGAAAFLWSGIRATRPAARLAAAEPLSTKAR
jgi:MFS family permease